MAKDLRLPAYEDSDRRASGVVHHTLDHLVEVVDRDLRVFDMAMVGNRLQEPVEEPQASVYRHYLASLIGPLLLEYQAFPARKEVN